MVFMALPPFASEVFAALVAAVATLALIRRRPARAYDWKRETDALTLKMRHPWRYRWTKWTTGA